MPTSCDADTSDEVGGTKRSQQVFQILNGNLLTGAYLLDGDYSVSVSVAESQIDHGPCAAARSGTQFHDSILTLLTQ